MRPTFVVHVTAATLALNAPRALAQAPATRADSASAVADSLIAVGTPDALDRALALRRRALAIYAQRGDQKNEGVQLNGIGNIHYLAARLDSALVYYRQAAAARLDARDSAGYGRTVGNIANVFADLGQNDSAITRYRQARTIARAVKSRADESGPVSNLGTTFYQIGQLDSALVYLTEGAAINREIGDKQGEGQTRLSIGLLFYSRGQQGHAMRETRSALALGGEIGDRVLRASALQNIGGIFNMLGELDSALAHYRLALDEHRATSSSRGEAGTQQNIGEIFSALSQYDSALVYLEAAAAIEKQIGDKRELGRTLLNIGTALFRQGRFPEALSRFEEALALRHEVQDRAGEGKVLANIATMLATTQNRADSAVRLARLALDAARETADRNGEAGALGVIATIYEMTGRRDSALAAFRSELAIARETGDRREMAEALSSVGRVLSGEGILAAADAYFDSAATARARVSQRAGPDVNRVSLAESQTSLFDDWTRLWLRRESESPATRALGALAAQERGRAQALLDLMRDSAFADSSLPRQRNLPRDGAALVRSVTSAGATLLAYAIVGDSLLVWSARPGASARLEIVKVGRDSLARLVAAFRAALGADASSVIANAPAVSQGAPREESSRSAGVAASGGSRWNERAAALGSVLFPRVARETIANARKVVIVPVGILAEVPFAAVPSGPQRPPLGQSAAIQYSPSLEIYRTLRMRGSRDAHGPALVVGNPSMPALPAQGDIRGTLSPLPAAQLEATTVARALHTTALVGPSATESEVRRRLPEARVVHLATHGVAYSSNALARRSFVALAPGDGNDGLLSVGEMIDDPAVRLKADLVVLSACQTGLGTPSEAEGTIGLQRAFLAKGARGVLVSLWSVSDEATAFLMNRFYAHWRGANPQGQDAAEALRLAQREVRSESRWRHPRYWAAFQLVGGSR
jgi:tetratricopeptide (TPR) repeat protein